MEMIVRESPPPRRLARVPSAPEVVAPALRTWAVEVVRIARAAYGRGVGFEGPVTVRGETLIVFRVRHEALWAERGTQPHFLYRRARQAKKRLRAVHGPPLPGTRKRRKSRTRRAHFAFLYAPGTALPVRGNRERTLRVHEEPNRKGHRLHPRGRAALTGRDPRSARTPPNAHT